MEHIEQRNYIRQTAIESVKSLLKNLPEHKKHPLDAIRMTDRTIGGLLAHPESPAYDGYRTYSTVLFPSGLEATLPGKDIILILNNSKTTIIKDGKARVIDIPSALKHPEKGVAQIIGPYLARLLFIVRAQILNQLIATEKNGDDWRVNLTANNAAQHVLKDYSPYQATLDKLFPRKRYWLEQLCPCIRVSEDNETDSATSTISP